MQPGKVDNTHALHIAQEQQAVRNTAQNILSLEHVRKLFLLHHVSNDNTHVGKVPNFYSGSTQLDSRQEQQFT